MSRNKLKQLEEDLEQEDWKEIKTKKKKEANIRKLRKEKNRN